MECGSDFDCPNGYVCNERGECVDGGTTGNGGEQEIPCNSQTDCDLYGRICEEGYSLTSDRLQRHRLAPPSEPSAATAAGGAVR